eukprot:GHUV01036427.1.p1 GENE.GHUV01036427.1~~GHUV01036427.1.p1  ORF type:complete len:152 (-),score=25.06 GHUV01036427.1:561-1016(-)
MRDKSRSGGVLMEMATNLIQSDPDIRHHPGNITLSRAEQCYRLCVLLVTAVADGQAAHQILCAVNTGVIILQQHKASTVVMFTQQGKKLGPSPLPQGCHVLEVPVIFASFSASRQFGFFCRPACSSDARADRCRDWLQGVLINKACQLALV